MEACRHKVITACTRSQTSRALTTGPTEEADMKPFCIAALTVLLFTFCSLTLSQNSHKPNKCCFRYMESRIPEPFVKRFEETSPECRSPGVIFFTTQKKEICANPEEKWVKRLMRKVQNRMKSSMSVTGSEDEHIH
ncbi:C-C motif chemokine 4 homolog [Brachyhypopomus gauderio]|uniref:C-C motif chemokine 4 homolog n=1 Tax=Brachyhypopomus gauderio TaxID=698409 RepID=UPI004042BEB8